MAGADHARAQVQRHFALVLEKRLQQWRHPRRYLSFSDRKLDTIIAYAVIIVPKDGPDEAAYKIAHAIHQNLDYLRSVNAALKDLTPMDLVKNLGVPLHPGAVQYYKEAGITK